MPDFLADSLVTRDASRPGVLHATLSPSWAVWGPNGGYLAAIALRSAMAESRLPRPASFHCHFLAIGAFEPVEIAVSSLGGGRRAESLRIDVRQNERPLLAASAWMVDDGLQGYEHEAARALRMADAFEREMSNPVLTGPLNMAQITLGCALNWRGAPKLCGQEWRASRPKLAAWADKIAARPSFAKTAPPPPEPH